MKYNKLIRDNIPEIIKNNGKECTIEVLKEQCQKALERYWNR